MKKLYQIAIPVVCLLAAIALYLTNRHSAVSDPAQPDASPGLKSESVEPAEHVISPPATSPDPEHRSSKIADIPADPDANYAGWPLEPISVSKLDSEYENSWPGAQVISAFEGIVPGGLTRRVMLIQPADLPYPVRIEDLHSEGEKTLRRTEMVANRFILKAKDGSVEDLERYAASRGSRLRKIGAAGLYRMEMRTLEPDGVPLAIKEILNQTDYLEYAEPDTIYRTLLDPNDPKFAEGTLWGLHNSGQKNGIADADIDAPEAWDIRTSAADVIVGVIDSGVNYNHEDLRDNMWVNPGEDGFDALGRDKRNNQIDDDGNGYVDDVHGINAIELSGDPLDDNDHGSHCAGTIAGRGNNGVGVTGVAWEARIMGLKFLSSTGSGSSSDAILCLQYAIDHGARLTSNSWGGGDFNEALFDMIRYAGNEDLLFVVAAGNSSSDNDAVGVYPSGYPLENVISVAAMDREDKLANFSCYGSGSVDIGAPGVAITSSVSSGTNAYASFNGTSMAAPHVAGAATLLMAQFPDSDAAGIKNRLLKSVRPVEDLRDTVVSKGFLNLHNALLSTDDRPWNDDFAKAHVVVDEVETIRATNSHATTEAGEPVHGGVAPNTVWFAYKAYADGPIVAKTEDSDFDTVIAVYTGESVDQLTLVAENDDADGLTTSRVQFQGEEDTTYYLAVAGKGGEEGFVSFSISGPPREDMLNKAIAVDRLPFSIAQDITNASAESGEPAHAGNPPNASVWYRLNVTTGGQATVRTRHSEIDTVLAVYTSPLASPGVQDLILLVANDDGNYGENWSEVTLNVTPGRNYWIAVDGKDGARGRVQIAGAFKPVNDDFSNAFPVTTATYRTQVDDTAIFFATREAGEPNHDNAGAMGSIWWSFRPPMTDDYVIAVDGNVVLALYTGNSVDALTLLADDENDGNGLSRIIIENADPGTTYHLAYAWRTDVVQWNRVLSIQPHTPIVNDNLANATVIPGNIDYPANNPFKESFDNTNATAEADEHSVYAEGGHSVWYQWTPSENGDYVFSANGSEAEYLSIIIHVLTGSTADGLQHSDLTYLTHDYYSGQEFLPWINFHATAGKTYYIQISQSSPIFLKVGLVNFNFYRFDRPANDDLANALEVPGLFVQREFYNSGATRELGEPRHASTNWYYNDFRPHWVDDGGGGLWSVGIDIERVESTVWFKWTPEAGHLGVPTAVSSFFSGGATALMVYEADSEIATPTYGDLQPVMAMHPNPDRIPQGATTEAGFADRLNPHKLWNSDPAYPDMYPPDPDYNEAYPDNRDPDWRPGSSFCFMGSHRYGEVKFMPEAGKTYYIVMGGTEVNAFSLLRLSIWQNPNDDLANAEVITGTNIRVETANFAATREEDEPYHYIRSSDTVSQASLPGGRSLWYQWTCPEDGVYTFDTYHSYLGWDDFPVPVPASDWPASQNWGGYMQLSVYTSSSQNPSMADLERVDCQSIMAFNQNKNAKMAFLCSAGTTYYIALDDIVLGAAWGRNDYTFQDYGPKSEWGNRAILALNIKKGTLSNDNLANATELPADTTAAPFIEGVYHEFVDLAYAWHEPGEPNHKVKNTAFTKSAWWKWTAPANGTYWIGAAPDYYHHECADIYSLAASGDRHAAGVSVYAGPAVNPTMGSLSLVREINSDNTAQNFSAGVTSFAALAGQTYYFALAMEEHHRNFDNGAYYSGIQFGQVPANDDFSDATPIVGHIKTVYGNNMGATEEAGEPRIDNGWYLTGATDTSVWWKWTAPGSGLTTISTWGSYIVNELGIYTGSAVDALNLVIREKTGQHIDNRDTYAEKMDEATREVTFNAAAGTTYYIKVNGGGWDREVQGPITLSILGQPGIPIAPSDFTYTRITASRIDFSWSDNSFDETRFVIQRSLSVSGPWTEVLNTGASNIIHGSDLNATLGYQYRLRAENSIGTSDWIYLDATSDFIPSGYDQAWKDKAFYPGATGPETEPTADFNSDGRANLLDYAYQIRANTPGDATGKLPAFRLVESLGNLYLEYRFRRIVGGTGSPVSETGYEASGVRYTLEYSESLAEASWQTGIDRLELAGDPVPNGDGTEWVTLRVSIPSGEVPIFLRLLVQ